MADSTRWWQRFATVRARTTIAATVIVGVALTVAVVLLVVLLRRSLVDHIDEVAELRADDIAGLVSQDALPSTIGVGGDDIAIAQVVDARGEVVASTPGHDGAPIADFHQTGPEPEWRTVLLPDEDVAGFRVVSLRATSPRGPVTVYVAASLEPVDDTIAIVRRALYFGAPFLLMLVGFTTWLVVGGALRPVEGIRSEVADISGGSLDRRVAVPATDDEVSRLATTMNAMLDRLESAAERQRRFVADASHELRTPLASARTDLEVALENPDRADWRATAADLLAANRRMEKLVTDLLYLARSEEGASHALAVPVDLDDIVLEEVARLRTEGRVPIDTTKVSGAAVLGRRDELTRVVRNLLDNADRHARSSITVDVSTTDGQATLVVADDGAGVPAEDRERIFERFTRLDEARSRGTGGSGLGLAIAREIVEGHDGTIEVAGGPGARFIVRLPAA